MGECFWVGLFGCLSVKACHLNKLCSDSFDYFHTKDISPTCACSNIWTQYFIKQRILHHCEIWPNMTSNYATTSKVRYGLKKTSWRQLCVIASEGLPSIMVLLFVVFLFICHLIWVRNLPGRSCGPIACIDNNLPLSLTVSSRHLGSQSLALSTSSYSLTIFSLYLSLFIHSGTVPCVITIERPLDLVTYPSRLPFLDWWHNIF